MRIRVSILVLGHRINRGGKSTHSRRYFFSFYLSESEELLLLRRPASSLEEKRRLRQSSSEGREVGDEAGTARASLLLL